MQKGILCKTVLLNVDKKDCSYLFLIPPVRTYTFLLISNYQYNSTQQKDRDNCQNKYAIEIKNIPLSPSLPRLDI